MDYAQRILSDPIRPWMTGLPDGIRFSVNNVYFLSTYGAPSKVKSFIFRATDTAIREAELAATEAGIMISGPNGLPFSSTIGPWLWHNPGMAGLPANDGTPRTWFSISHKSAGGLPIETKPSGHDFAAAQTAVRDATLREEYVATILTRIWYNCDARPVAEPNDHGRALDATTVRTYQHAPE